jgi:hypothetical protein
VERQECCNRIVSESVVSYWDYYNFYFFDYLAKRSRFQCTFMDNEIWHVVETLCESYATFRKFGMYYELDPRTFLITPEGKLKTMWCHLRTQNQHLKFYQYFERGEETEPFYYSPEEVQFMYQKEKTFKLNFDKCNSFRLGMVLLRCLTLSEPLHHFYNPSMTRINIAGVRNLINEQVVPNYPDEITNLVKSLLRVEPGERPSPMEVYERYSKNFSPEFELKVCGKSEKDKKYLAEKISAGHNERYKSPKKALVAEDLES